MQRGDIYVRVFKQDFRLFAGLGIELDYSGFVPSNIRNTVQSLVVERKKLGRKAFFEVCGKDGFPCLVRCFAVKQTCVNAVSSGGNSDVSVVVGCPCSNVARVSSDKLQITGLD